MLALGASAIRAQTPMQVQIRAAAVEMCAAVRAGEFDKVIEQMHPALIEMNGGREQTLTALKKGAAEMAHAGITFESLEIGAPGEPVNAGDKLFCVVPETVHLNAPTAKIESDSFLLAVSTDISKPWTFLDGASLTPDMVKRLFPDFPTSLKLPDRKLPKITPTR